MSELNDPENYKKDIEERLKEIIQVYIRIVVDYLHFMAKSKNIKQKCMKFILLRGLETMTHVFNYTLYCTKNLELTESYSEKSMFYYIEFISQINKISQDQPIFLHFTSKDAVVYVYKKTIYDIKNTLILESNDETTIQIYKDVNLYTQLIKNIAMEQDNLLHKQSIIIFEKLSSKIKTVKNISTVFEKIII